METAQAKNRGNLLFLDFDGVCNSFDTGSYLTHKPEDYGVDPKIMDRIREICGKRNARVIVSSNWRRFSMKDGYYVFGGVKYQNPLGKLYREIGDLIDGTLPLDRHITKSEALELWFEDNPEFNGKYAVLDDDPDEGFANNANFRKNFWLTDMENGLTEKIKNDIMEHLA